MVFGAPRSGEPFKGGKNFVVSRLEAHENFGASLNSYWCQIAKKENGT